METERDFDKGGKIQELIYNNLCCQCDWVYQKVVIFKQ